MDLPASGLWNVRYPKFGVDELVQLSQPAPLADWSLAVVFTILPPIAIVKVLHLLLCEQKIAVMSTDVGLVSAVAAALTHLVDPLRWECVHVPLKPMELDSVDMLECPNPFVVGIAEEVDPSIVPPDVTVLSLEGAPELTLAQDALSGQAHSSFTLIHKLQCLPQWALVNSRKAASERARIYSQGLTPEERSRVTAYKGVLHDYVAGLCGDVGEPEAWRRYGEYNQDTKDFEFIPDSFLEPRVQALALQEVSLV